jgi:ribonuclease HII
MKLAAGFGYETKLWKEGVRFIAGVDEVGRGAWAGPVVAAAVVFPQKINFPEKLFDSKMVSPLQRERLSGLILQYAVSVGVGRVEIPTINKIGIGRASHKAFRSAVKLLSVIPDQIFVDAFYIKNLNRRNQKPIKNGDKLCASIAAASIVAKVYRDNLMRQLDKKFPGYGFAAHKGYGTAFHQESIKNLSLSSMHRKSFNLTPYTG